MATNVLNLAKVENQQILSNVSAFNLSEQVRNCFLQLEDKWSGKNLDADFDFGEVQICGNEELLRQVWLNLLDNAVKYSDREGNIEWKFSGYGKGVKIVLSNTTDGVPEGELSRLFERFYRLDSSRSRQTGGHGVGLSMAKSIVEAHKGKITAKSPDGKLIVFTIIF